MIYLLQQECGKTEYQDPASEKCAPCSDCLYHENTEKFCKRLCPFPLLRVTSTTLAPDIHVDTQDINKGSIQSTSTIESIAMICIFVLVVSIFVVISMVFLCNCKCMIEKSANILSRLLNNNQHGPKSRHNSKSSDIEDSLPSINFRPSKYSPLSIRQAIPNYLEAFHITSDTESPITNPERFALATTSSRDEGTTVELPLRSVPDRVSTLNRTTPSRDTAQQSTTHESAGQNIQSIDNSNPRAILNSAILFDSFVSQLHSSGIKLSDSQLSRFSNSLSQMYNTYTDSEDLTNFNVPQEALWSTMPNDTRNNILAIDRVTNVELIPLKERDNVLVITFIGESVWEAREIIKSTVGLEDNQYIVRLINTE